MATFYIDPSSPNNGTGSFSSPYNTWASVTWTAGNSYLQKAGTTQTGYRVYVTTGGTSSSNRVILGSYDPETGLQTSDVKLRAILNGQGTAQTLRIADNINWVWVDNFEIFGTDGTGGSRAIGVYFGNGASLPSHNIELSNLYVHDIKADGLSDTSDCNGIQGFGNYAIIRNCKITRIPADGIWLQGSNYQIIDNYISEVSTKAIYGDNIQTNGDISLRNDFGYIARNFLDHSNKNSKQVIIYGGINYSSNGIIEDNYCVMAPLDFLNINTSCIFIEASNSIVRRNICIGGFFGIMTSSSGTDILVHSNICKKNHRGISTDTTGLTAVNNLVQDAIVFGIFGNTDTTAVIKNNILLNCATGISMHGSAIEDYNCFYGNTTDRSLTAGVASWGINSIFTNPLLNSFSRLTEASPAIMAGSRFNFIQDANGSTFQSPPSIGAYEYVRPRTAATTRTMRS